MQTVKEPQKWSVMVEDKDNQVGLINTIRYLEETSNEISAAAIEDLIVELDLERLQTANSELIAQFVMIQSNLVRTNGRLRIVNANPELKSSFDVVMLDKIINITYLGLAEEDEDAYDDDDDYYDFDDEDDEDDEE